MKLIQGIIFMFRPPTRENPNGVWYSPRYHCRSAGKGYWGVYHTTERTLVWHCHGIKQAHKRMAELERIADAKEAQ